MSTVVQHITHVFADTIPDTPCAVITHSTTFLGVDLYGIVLYTGKNSEDQPSVATLDEALAIAAAHADALDTADSKDTNLELLFKIKQLETVIAELRAGRDAAVEAVK